MRRAVAALVMSAALAGPAAYCPAGAAASNPAVFLLATLATSTGRVVAMGTAFFTAADGAALTNSHVVYFDRTDAAQYQLIAVYGREFYSASVLCASTLSVPPTPDAKPGKGVLGRDIARIKVEPSRVAGAGKVLRLPCRP